MILTSRARALALGIAEERLVYIHGGAAADQPRDILQRTGCRCAPRRWRRS
ncbi:hypothetical protein AB5I41_08805 [Sphingomonas sp. MMS24-JH45]